jgi:lipoyl(octanoyl) transferase
VTLATRWPSARGADYAETLARMQAYTESRGPDSPDIFWPVEHNAVYTLGVAGQLQHVLNPGSIPVVRSDRGGQVTYHGPGQLVVYTLLDLRRLGLSIRALVTALEQGVITMLGALGIPRAQRICGAPGVYLPAQALDHNESATAVALAPGPEALKIASLGLKVRRGACYHGIALNVRLDSSAFDRINPCGYPGLGITDLYRQGIDIAWDEAADILEQHLRQQLYPSKATSL